MKSIEMKSTENKEIMPKTLIKTEFLYLFKKICPTNAME